VTFCLSPLEQMSKRQGLDAFWTYLCGVKFSPSLFFPARMCTCAHARTHKSVGTAFLTRPIPPTLVMSLRAAMLCACLSASIRTLVRTATGRLRVRPAAYAAGCLRVRPAAAAPWLPQGTLRPAAGPSSWLYYLRRYAACDPIFTHTHPPTLHLLAMPPTEVRNGL